MQFKFLFKLEILTFSLQITSFLTHLLISESNQIFQ